MNPRELDKLFNYWAHKVVTSGLLGVVVAGGILICLVELWANWRMAKRMGYPGPWSLLLWIPYANILFWAGLAFWRWPNQRR